MCKGAGPELPKGTSFGKKGTFLKKSLHLYKVGGIKLKWVHTSISCYPIAMFIWALKKNRIWLRMTHPFGTLGDSPLTGLAPGYA